MENQRYEIGISAVIASLRGRLQSPRWRVISFAVTHLGWALFLLVGIVSLISSAFRPVRNGVYIWLLVYFVYLLLLELLGRVISGFYETSAFRMVRIQVTILLIGILVFLTGGATSYFWLVFLWPLFASAVYFDRWLVTWIVCIEAAVLYVAASVLAAGAVSGLDPVLLLINTLVLFGLTIVLRYLVETIRMYQASEEMIDQVNVLQEMRLEVSAGLQNILDTVTDQAVRLIGAKSGSLMLVEAGRLHFRSRTGPDVSESAARGSFEIGEGIAGWVAQTGQPYICPDTEEDPHFVPVISGPSMRSVLSVPITSHGATIGVISVDSEEVARFTRDDVSILMALADQVGVVIDRAQLLESFKEIGEKALSSSSDLGDDVVAAIHRLTGCPVAFWQRDPTNKDRAIIRAHRELRAEYVEERSLDLGHSLTGQAIQTGEPQEAFHIQEDERVSPETKREAAQMGWESMLVVPLPAGANRIVGTVSIYSYEQRRFASWERDLLYTFAVQAGTAIRNADRLRMIQQLGEIGRSISTLEASEEALEETLSQIAVAAKDVLGADIVDLYRYRLDKNQFELPPIMVGERRTPEFITKQILPDDVVAKIVASGEAIYSSDAQYDPILAGERETDQNAQPAQRFVFREGIVSAACIPLKVGDEVVGVLFVSYRQRLNFDVEAELREVVETFAAQAAIAVHNARLYEQRTREIAALQEINAAIPVQTLDEVEQLVANKAKTLTGADYSVLRLTDESGQRLLVEASSDPDRRKDPLLIDDMSFTGRVASQERAELCSDVSQVDYYLKWYPEVKSCMATPLMYGGQLIGTMYVESKRLGAFSEKRQLELLKSFADQAAVAIENARLFRKIERQTVELTALYRTGKDITSIMGLDELLRTIVDRSIELTMADRALILLVNEETEEVESVGQGFAPGQIDSITYQEVQDGISGYVMKKGEPTISEDILADPRNTGVALEMAKKERDRGRSVAVAPLPIKGRPIGTLTVINKAEKPVFDKADLDLVTMLASQAAVAIENARLYEQRSQDIAALQQVNEAVISEDLDETLQLIVQKAVSVLTGEYSELWLLEAQTGDLHLAAVHGAGVEEAKKVHRIEAKADSINMRVARSGRPNICPDVDGETGFLRIYEKAQSSVTVPLKYKEEVIGTLNVESDRRNAFTDEDSELLASFGDQAAVAIETARLFERIERKTRNLQVLYDMGQRLASGVQLSEPEIIDLIEEQASRLMDTRNMYIALYDAATDTVSFPFMRVDGEPEKVPARSGGYGRTEWIIEHKRTMLITTRAESEEWYGKPGRKEYIQQPFSSWVGAPMLVGDEVLGVIAAYHEDKEYVYDEDDLEIITLMANQAAVALKSAQQLEIMKDLSVDLSAGVLGS